MICGRAYAAAHPATGGGDMTQSARSLSATAAVVVTLCACSAGSPPSPQPPLQQSQATPSASTTAATTGSPQGSGSASPSARPVPVIRIQDGPASPISPDADIYYYKLERHACTDLSKTPTNSAEGALFAALGTVCLAIAHPGRRVDWAAAQHAYDQAAQDLTGCLLSSARDTLGRALTAHQQNPTAAPTFGTPPKTFRMYAGDPQRGPGDQLPPGRANRC